MRATRVQTVPWDSTAVAVLYTDGLSGRWGPAKYPGLLSRHPSLIASVLFRVQPTDPTTLAAVIMTITLVAAGACWLPAWRASRLDPNVVLRTD